MMMQELLYGLAGLAVFVIGLRGVLLHDNWLLRVLSLNVCGAGVFLTFVAIAYRGLALPADPVPHALVLTGIVVAVSAMAMALALGRRLRSYDD